MYEANIQRNFNLFFLYSFKNIIEKYAIIHFKLLSKILVFTSIL